MSIHSQRHYFNQQKNRYPQQEALSPLLPQQIELDHILHELGTLKGKKVMDFGAGNGRITFFFLKHGYHVTAVDISHKSLAALRATYRKYRLPTWGRLTTYTAIPKGKKFDAIVGADILHHIDIPICLPRLFQALTRGGRIAFSEPNAWHVPWYIFLLVSRLPWSIEKGILSCTKSNLSLRFRQAGFHKIRITGHGAFPTSFFSWFPKLCRINALTWGNLPAIRMFAFRLIVSGE